MTDAERDLFAHAAGFVTPADVAAFAPSDPGYPAYVAAFDRILSSGQMPGRSSFDVSETIGLTRWHDAGREADPARFRRFRVLTNVVGIVQLRAGVEPPDVTPPNYCVASLVDDAHRLDDRTLMRLSRPVLDAFHDHLVERTPEEAPFALLGVMLVDACLGADGQHLSALAERLVEEERRHFGRASGDFLFGCTFFDQLRGTWRSLAEQLLPPATPGLRLVRDALLGG